MSAYEIRYANGHVSASYVSHDAAVSALRSEYPNAEIGHDGDLTCGGDRTLCWETREDSRNDDGARAVASIRRVEAEPSDAP